MITETTLSSGRETLFTRSLVPASPIAHVAIVHGYGDHGGRYEELMHWLGERQIASHALDLRGQGKSTGRRGFVRRWEEYLDDLSVFLASDAIKAATEAGLPLFALGHSHGALVVAAAELNGMLRPVTGCVLTSPFFRARVNIPKSKVLLAKLANPFVPWLIVKSGLSDGMMTSDPVMRQQSKTDPLLCRLGTPRWFLRQRIVQRQVMARANQFRLPVLMLTGDADPVADSASAVEFYQNAGSKDKTLHVYPGMLHELLRETDRQRVFTEIVQWLTRHIDLASKKTTAAT